MLSRRDSLRLLSTAGLGLALPVAWPVALAAAPTDRRLVVMILRGGLDGLAAVPPFGDPHYREQRGDLALAEPGTGDGVLDLDGRFGLHPALKAIHTMYGAKEALVFHAVATPYRRRSHFDAQDLLENGTAKPHGARDGWLNRALALYGAPKRRFGLAVGTSMPLVLRGDVPVGAWMPQRLPQVDDDFLGRLSRLYRSDPLLGAAFAEGIRSQEMSDEVMGRNGGMGGKKKRLKGAEVLPAIAASTGALLADDAGPRIAVLEAGGWDTHANQGLLTGRLARNLGALDKAMDRLKQAMTPVWAKTAVLIVTEFGRTVKPNGTRGTDHGTAGAAFLLGGGLEGGRVVAQWPGLGQAALREERDLAPTLDMRAVFKAALVDHLGLPEAAVDGQVLPDSGGTARVRGLWRA